MKTIDFIKCYWLVITLFILIAILTLSLWPVAQLPKVPGTDKSHHFIASSFIVFSGLIELIQPYVNRYGEWLDMAANVAGLGFGIIIASIIGYFDKQAKSKL